MTGPEICVAMLEWQSPSLPHSLQHLLCICKEVEKAKPTPKGANARVGQPLASASTKTDRIVRASSRIPFVFVNH
jgi:hypothetical protein